MTNEVVNDHRSEGCTLALYGQETGLEIKHLEQCGLSDISYLGKPAVRIPYSQNAGNDEPIRFRRARRGKNQFSWRKDSAACLYGLSRLGELRAVKRAVLCRSEADVLTLWKHGIPALGIPSESEWDEERDAAIFDCFDVIFVTASSGTPQIETGERWLTTSRIRDRASLLDLGKFKNFNEIYRSDPQHFDEQYLQIRNAAVPYSQHFKAHLQTKRSVAWDASSDIAETPRILDRFLGDLRRYGVVGENRAVKLLCLIMYTRFFDRPVSASLKGTSSVGKSWILDAVLEFFPPTAFYKLSAMSEKALAYSKEPLKNRFLVFAESAGMQGEFASYLIRSLLSEGQLRYETVINTGKKIEARLIQREGPTGLLLTTTAVSLHPENETRLFSVPLSDSKEQTGRILHLLASEAETKVDPVTPWHEFHEWIETGPHEVTIPFASTLADLVPPVAVRLRRDFRAVLSLIRAHAMLHQASRRFDDNKRIIAEIEDYTAVYSLVNDLLSEGVGSTVSDSIRKTVATVRLLTKTDTAGVSVTRLAKELDIDKSAASRRVKSAIAKGFIINNEEKAGVPSKLVLDDPMPDNTETLPPPQKLQEACCSVVTPVSNPAPPPPLPHSALIAAATALGAKVTVTTTS